MEKHLHIVTHEIPWPAGYGGVMDLYFKLISLHEKGVRIHLHCFSTIPLTHEAAEKLGNLCFAIKTYPRKKWPALKYLFLPYIVSSRVSNEIKEELTKDLYPVLFEGVHTCHAVCRLPETNSRFLLRAHNTEYLYYSNLMRLESNFIKKAYFLVESLLLRRFESKIAKKMHVTLTVSDLDRKRYVEKFHANRAHFLPVFHGFQFQSISGYGRSVLYHGNLSINENEAAAIWIIKNIAAAIPERPFIIAGKNPTEVLRKTADDFSNVRLLENPDDHALQQCIAQAHIHLLPSFNNTGVKLKLLHVMHSGRFCITQSNAVSGSGLESCCIIADNKQKTILAIRRLFEQSFGWEETEKRKAALNSLYENNKNVESLMKWIW